MKSHSVKTLAVLIFILTIVVGLIATGTVLFAGAGVDIIISGVVLFFLLEALGSILENLEEINYSLKQIATKKPSEPSILNRQTSAPTVKNVGSTWTCPDCGTVNPTSSRICKDCGRDK